MPLATQLASSVSTVLAMMIAPASRRCVVSVASYGGTSPANASAPPVVGMSVVWMLSLSAIGMPCSGPRTRPGRRSRSRASASSSARGLTVIAALRRLFVARDAVERLLHDVTRRGAAAAPAPCACRRCVASTTENGRAAAVRPRLAAPPCTPASAATHQRRARREAAHASERYHEAVSCHDVTAPRHRRLVRASARRSPTCSPRNGFDLVITARREDRLRAVAERPARAARRATSTSSPVDHADPSSAARLCDELAARGLAVDALVNNAGYGVPGAVQRRRRGRCTTTFCR